MFIDKLYYVKIATNPQRFKYNKLGFVCNLGDVIRVDVSTLIKIGSTIKVGCVCEECNNIFERQARQILERQSGDKYCTKCALKFTSTGKIYTIESRLKISNALKGISRSKEHRENISKSRKLSLKCKESSICNLPKPQCGEDNPAWVKKDGYKLYLYQCNRVRLKTIKEQNLVRQKSEGIHYKISPKTAYKIGISPKIVGSKLIILTKSSYGSIRALITNALPKIKKEVKALGFIKEFRRYHAAVIRKTNKIYKEFKDTINPDNLSRGKQGKNNNYHLDHIIPINICWKNKISVELCSSLENLKIIPWRDNISKNGRLLNEHKYLLEQLILRSKNVNSRI